MAWQIDRRGVTASKGEEPRTEGQLGPEFTARYTNPEMEGRIVLVTAYAHAPVHEDAEGDYVGADLDSLGIMYETSYTIYPGDPEYFDDDPTWEHTDAAESLDTAPLGKNVELAVTLAEQWLKRFDPNRDIAWDGEEF